MNAEVEKKEPEKILFNWQAADRPYKKRGMGYYFNIVAISVVIGLVLLFFYQYILLGVVFALLFVGIVLGTVPPKDVDYKITTYGIRVAEHLYDWNLLRKFWPSTILDHHVIIVATEMKFPKQLILMYRKEDLAKITQIMKEYIKLVPPPEPTWMDKRAEDLSKLVNIGQK